MLNCKGMVQDMQQGLNERKMQGDKSAKSAFMSVLRAVALSGIVASCAYAGGKADDYMRTSVSHLFDNPNKLECDGSNRTAICQVDRYELQGLEGFTLRNYRYTLDYKDSRVIERVSGAIEAPQNYDLKVFVPKSFECADFTQINNEKEQVANQLVCTINSDAYRLWLRVRSKSHSASFAELNSLSLLQKSTAFVEKIVAGYAASSKENKSVDEVTAELKAALHNIDVNIHGVDIVITKPQLPQKIYEHLFADMLEYMDDASDNTQKRYNQLSHTIYNSGVGYIYGNIMGYVWGNDTIDLRTKESLNKLFTILRDSAMLDSDIRTISITLTNRTKKGFNLGRAFDKMTQGSDNFSRLEKERAGETMNIFSGDVFNRYRIDVGAARLR